MFAGVSKATKRCAVVVTRSHVTSTAAKPQSSVFATQVDVERRAQILRRQFGIRSNSHSYGKDKTESALKGETTVPSEQLFFLGVQKYEYSLASGFKRLEL